MARRVRHLRVAARLPPRPHARAGGRDLQRFARPRTPARGGDRARPAHRRSPARVVVLVGDAELDEGSNAEAIEYAAGVGLANFTVVAIDNNSSSYAVRGRMAARFATNGWHTTTVDGRDHGQLRAALRHREPHALVAVVAQVEDK